MGNVFGECHTSFVYFDIRPYPTLRTFSVVDAVDQSLPSFLNSFYIMIELVLVMDIADILLIGR
jgi:hypothetical protein